MRYLTLLLFLLLAACKHEGDSSPQAEAGEERSGGSATLFDASSNAFGGAVEGLSSTEQTDFVVGNSFFRSNWVPSPASTTARDGLGPMMNAVSCGACHPQDGRGLAPLPGEEPLGVLLRIGGADGTPDPVYGDQFQNRAIATARPEGNIRVSYETFNHTYPDGATVPMRRIRYAIENWGFGPAMAGLQVSPRIGQQLPGLGLLEAIPAEAITAAADENDTDKDGISGRAAWVTASDGTRKLGRFGWKAGKASLADQAAAAFANDMGLTSDINPHDAMTPTQTALYGNLPNGGTPEVEADKFVAVRFYLQTLAIPARRQVGDADVLAGKALFAQIGCGKCHKARWQTGAAVTSTLTNQKIRPYTDMLLHDMGPDLADNRAEGGATGVEWRTPPLWGLGLIATVSGRADLLHDGRAENAEQAILWHGGEAEGVKQNFRQLSAKERAQVLRFLQSL